MLPIVVSMAMSANINVSRLLMPLAFASSMGGMMTLIGTPPNLVIQNALIEAGYERLSFFTFTPVGLVCVTVGLIVLIPLSKIFLTKKSDKEARGKRKNKSLQELAGEYQLSQNLYRVEVEESSGFVGKTIQELGDSAEVSCDDFGGSPPFGFVSTSSRQKSRRWQKPEL